MARLRIRQRFQLDAATDLCLMPKILAGWQFGEGRIKWRRLAIFIEELAPYSENKMTDKELRNALKSTVLGCGESWSLALDAS